MLQLEMYEVVLEVLFFIFKTSRKYKVISPIKKWFGALSHLGTWKICFGHTFGICTVFLLDLSSHNQTDAFSNHPYGRRFCISLLSLQP